MLQLVCKYASHFFSTRRTIILALLTAMYNWVCRRSFIPFFFRSRWHASSSSRFLLAYILWIGSGSICRIVSVIGYWLAYYKATKRLAQYVELCYLTVWVHASVCLCVCKLLYWHKQMCKQDCNSYQFNLEKNAALSKYAKECIPIFPMDSMGNNHTKI